MDQFTNAFKSFIHGVIIPGDNVSTAEFTPKSRVSFTLAPVQRRTSFVPATNATSSKLPLRFSQIGFERESVLAAHQL